MKPQPPCLVPGRNESSLLIFNQSPGGAFQDRFAFGLLAVPQPLHALIDKDTTQVITYVSHLKPGPLLSHFFAIERQVRYILIKPSAASPSSIPHQAFRSIHIYIYTPI
jgi:hypothetical protein